MKKITCECAGCKAKFGGIVADENLELACPSCEGKDIKILDEVNIESGCHGCQNCPGCGN